MNNINSIETVTSVETNKTDRHLISLAFMFGLFMPNGNLFYILVPIVTLFLGLRYSKFNNTVFSFKYVLLVIILISFILFSFTSYEKVDIKGLMRNIVIFQFILFFPFAKNVRISNAYLYFALIYIFISQISYMLGVNPIISFFNNYYPYEGDRYFYESDYLMSMAKEMSLTNRSLRLGGLFHNMNQASRYLTIILAVYLIENYNTSFKSKLPFLFIYSLSVIATGSRTGFFISVFMLGYFMYLKSKNKKNKVAKYLQLFVILLLIISFILATNSNLTETYRFLDYDEGLNKSLFVKFGILFAYLSENLGVIDLVFGKFTNYGFSAIHFDSEIGELIYRYGFSMLIAFVLFFIIIYRKLNPKYRIFLIVLLWVISATVILSYRTGFVFFLLLSKYSYSSLDKRKPALINL